VTAPLGEDLGHTGPEPRWPGVVTSAPLAPSAPTLTRRALLGGVGAASAGLAVMATGPVVGGPLAKLAVLAPRARGRGDGPNEFPVNKTFAAANIPRHEVGPDWRLRLRAGDERRAVRTCEELLAMDQVTAELPIACVEGLVDDPDLDRGADGRPRSARGCPRSRRRRCALDAASRNAAQRHAGPGQVTHPEGILALRVNGADLSLDHGYPARVIVPALPGVHCTEWVGAMVFA
jgi:DMSO/TMAO reductase YedYZ molybdopterin-dependent catalytic subunit